MNRGEVWCAQRAPVGRPDLAMEDAASPPSLAPHARDDRPDPAVPRRRPRSIRVLRGLVTSVAIAVTVLFAGMALLPMLGMRTMIVLSGSMAPTFDTGDAVIVDTTQPEEVDVGDVITFAGYGTEQLTTHRVIDVRDIDGRLHFRTQGDANPDPDPNLAPAGGLQGTVRAVLPYMGRILAPMLTRVGKLAILGLPALVLVARQLRTLRRSTRTLSRPGRSAPQATAVAAVIIVAATVAGVTVARSLATFTGATQAGDSTFQTGTFDSN